MRYGLAPDTHMAVVDGDVVLLDARADRYACVAACDSAAIRTGYPARRWEDSSLVRELAESGYLEPASDTPVIARQLPPAPEQDLHMLHGDLPLPAPSDLVHAALSALSTAWRLRTQRPMHWLRSGADNEVRKDACVAEARRFAEAHLYLPRLTRCLPHSLALLDFLKRRGCPAQLIFGVRTHPFEAHCWVQAGAVVLNDTLSHARWYAPIAWS
jgi:hypothetical protein